MPTLNGAAGAASFERRSAIKASKTISLPDAVSDRVHQRVDAGLYASASDYVRALILRDLAGEDDPPHALDRSIVETFTEMRAGGRRHRCRVRGRRRRDTAIGRSPSAVRVVLSPRAIHDLRRIVLYIAEDDPTRALSFVAACRETARRIGDTPDAFPLLPRYEAAGIRRRSWKRHGILNSVMPDRIFVHPVMGPGRTSIARQDSQTILVCARWAPLLFANRDAPDAPVLQRPPLLD